MTDISAFPTISVVAENGQANTVTFTAGENITAGQVVGFAATGVSKTVVVMDATSGEHAIGVALYTATSGNVVAVCLPGSICYVANADDTTGIDAGDWVQQNDNAVGGTVSAASLAATGGATASLNELVVGMAIDDIAGGGTGRILVHPVVITQANSS